MRAFRVQGGIFLNQGVADSSLNLSDSRFRVKGTYCKPGTPAEANSYSWGLDKLTSWFW